MENVPFGESFLFTKKSIDRLLIIHYMEGVDAFRSFWAFLLEMLWLVYTNPNLSTCINICRFNNYFIITDECTALLDFYYAYISKSIF